MFCVHTPGHWFSVSYSDMSPCFSKPRKRQPKRTEGPPPSQPDLTQRELRVHLQRSLNQVPVLTQMSLLLSPWSWSGVENSFLLGCSYGVDTKLTVVPGKTVSQNGERHRLRSHVWSSQTFSVSLGNRTMKPGMVWDIMSSQHSGSSFKPSLGNIARPCLRRQGWVPLKSSRRLRLQVG